MKAKRAMASAAVLSATLGAALTTGAAAASGGRLAGATSTPPRSDVGVIMSANGEGEDPNAHSCTASVIHSRAHDLVITAAHCLVGTGEGLAFVPAYSEGKRPHGTWPVTKAYAADAWMDQGARSEQADYVILRVAPQEIDGVTRNVEDVTGALTLDVAAAKPSPRPRALPRVDVIAYNTDDDAPIACDTRVVSAGDGRAFHCDGFLTGSSGSPWIRDVVKKDEHVSALVGVLGGPQQGGCTPYTSFTSPIDDVTMKLLARAEANGPGDELPAPGGDGC